MAGGESLDWNGYQLTVKPRSQWRRLIWDFWPYWQAQKPRFLLEVTKIGPPAQSEIILPWIVRFANNQVTKGQVVLPPLQTGDKLSFELGGKFLGYTGDTLLIVPINLPPAPLEPYLTLYAFHTTPKVWISLAIVAGLLAGLFGSLLQYLFRL